MDSAAYEKRIDELEGDIVRYVTELTRFKKLVRHAEWRGFYQGADACPYCEARYADTYHRPRCSAFTMDGMMK